MTESTAFTTTGLRLPGDISVLLIDSRDDSPEAAKRIERSIQSGEGGNVTFVIFLGSGVWDFQLLYIALLLLMGHPKITDVPLERRR